MTRLEALTRQWEAECAAFPGRLSLLVTDAGSGEILMAEEADERAPAASLIKVPILLTALDQVARGARSLNEAVPIPPEQRLGDSEIFEPGAPGQERLVDLLFWMIAASDNTATNAVLRLLGLEAVNEFCLRLGLESTQVQRFMLNRAAARAGQDNTTSAADQERLYRLLYQRRMLTPELCDLALDTLLSQRDGSMALRYLPGPVAFAHKTGSLDFVSHDAGLFLALARPIFMAILSWDGPLPEGNHNQRRLIGRMARRIYDAYKDG